MKAEIPGCIPQKFAGLPVLRSGSRLTARCLSAVGGSRMKLMIQKRQQLRDAWNDGSGTFSHYPMRSEWYTEHQANGFSMAMGRRRGFCCKSCSRLAHWKFGIYTLVAS